MVILTECFRSNAIHSEFRSTIQRDLIVHDAVTTRHRIYIRSGNSRGVRIILTSRLGDLSDLAIRLSNEAVTIATSHHDIVGNDTIELHRDRDNGRTAVEDIVSSHAEGHQIVFVISTDNVDGLNTRSGVTLCPLDRLDVKSLLVSVVNRKSKSIILTIHIVVSCLSSIAIDHHVEIRKRMDEDSNSAAGSTLSLRVADGQSVVTATHHIVVSLNSDRRSIRRSRISARSGPVVFQRSIVTSVVSGAIQIHTFSTEAVVELSTSTEVIIDAVDDRSTLVIVDYDNLRISHTSGGEFLNGNIVRIVRISIQA